MNKRALRVKNITLVVLAVLTWLVCRVFSRPLPGIHRSWGFSQAVARNMSTFVIDNALPLATFIFFSAVALASVMLGGIMYRRFDRNRRAAIIFLKVGLFFMMAALYYISDSPVMAVFSTWREFSDYLAGTMMLLMPQVYAGFVEMIYRKKLFFILEWIGAVAAAAYYIGGIFGLPSVFNDWMVSLAILLFLIMMFTAVVFHIRNLLPRRFDYHLLHLVLTYIQAFLLLLAPVMSLLGLRDGYLGAMSVSMVIMVYLVFSEVTDVVARQYTRTADAEDFRKMAYIDGLCGISNRNAFLKEQEESFGCDELTYVVFDVNGLKLINDRHGHAEGDRIIQKAAELIQRSFDNTGKAFRIGGDEFAVIARYKSEVQIEHALRKLTRQIDSFNKRSEVPLDLAYGYARRTDTDTSTYELFTKADKAMYRCKRRSKGVQPAK